MVPKTRFSMSCCNGSNMVSSVLFDLGEKHLICFSRSMKGWNDAGKSIGNEREDGCVYKTF